MELNSLLWGGKTTICVMMKNCVVRVLFVAEPAMVEPTVTTALD